MSLKEEINKKGIKQRFLCERFDLSETIMSILIKYGHLYSVIMKYVKGRV